MPACILRGELAARLARVLPDAFAAEPLRGEPRSFADLSAFATGFVARPDALVGFELALAFFEGDLLRCGGLADGVDARRCCGVRLVLAAAFVPMDFDAETAERDVDRVERVREVMMRRKRSACREAKSFG